MLGNIRSTSRIRERGRARLKLRLPDWRSRFELASGHSFLDICEAYELAHIGLDFWGRSDTPISNAMIAEYQEAIAALELEAQALAARSNEDTEPLR